MRITEKHLLNIAAQAICDLGLTTFHVRDLDEREFGESRVSGIVAYTSVMEPEKLGGLAGLALKRGQSTDYRRTSVSDVAGMNVYIHWTGDEPKSCLVQMARHVIVAAMFDILATRRVMAIEAGPFAKSVTYRPQQCMRRFVSKLTLPRNPLPETASAA